jgi:DNA-binding beta-propeller fold protein YncE
MHTLASRVAFVAVIALVHLGTTRPAAAQLGGDANAGGPQIAEVAVLKDFPDWVGSVAFSPDSQLLAAGSYESVRLWSVADKAHVATLPVKGGFARSLAFSPDGKLLAVGGYQGITLFDVADHKPLRQLKGHRGYVLDLCFTADGAQLASAAEDRTARLWDVATGNEVRKFEGHTHPVTGIAISPDGKLLTTSAGDENRLTKPGEVKLWDLATGTEIRTFPAHERGATDVAFSPDGTRLVSTSLDEKANVYDVATGEAKGFFGGHSRPTNNVLFAAPSIAITGSGGRFKGKNEIKFWNPADGAEYGTIDKHEGKVSALALARNLKFLASGSYDKTVIVWDVTAVLSAGGVEYETTTAATQLVSTETKPLRIGIIGLDTSHAIAFTNLLNGATPPEWAQGAKIVAAYPKGSPDIESSTSRVPGYIEDVKKLGVEIVDSIDDLVTKVDAVCLESNDGRPHLEQILPVLKAGKPVFVDKPIAGSLTDAVAIFEAAHHYKVPVFSSSSLRWIEGGQDIRNGSLGKVLGADIFSPCSLEATHPDLFWYGIHGVEALFTIMGTGCQSVSRTTTPDFDVAVGLWDGGRIGSFRGIRAGSGGYGGTVFGEKSKATLERYGGYDLLVKAIVHFFRTGEAPVAEEETLEIYAFMEAADESKRQGGAPVKLETVLSKAREEAAAKLKTLK